MAPALLDLPNELLERILQCGLDPLDLVSCRGTCRRLRALVDGAGGYGALRALDVGPGWPLPLVKRIVFASEELTRLRLDARLPSQLRQLVGAVPLLRAHEIRELRARAPGLPEAALLDLLPRFTSLERLHLAWLDTDALVSRTAAQLRSQHLPASLRSLCIELDASTEPGRAPPLHVLGRLRAVCQAVRAMPRLPGDASGRELQLHVVAGGAMLRPGEVRGLLSEVARTDVLPTLRAWELWVSGAPNTPRRLRLALATGAADVPAEWAARPVLTMRQTMECLRLPLRPDVVDNDADSAVLPPPRRPLPAPALCPLTELYLEDVVYDLQLDWSAIAEVPLPLLRVLSFSAGWPFPSREHRRSVLDWIARLWDGCAHLHTVRLWRVPGLVQLQLATRPSPYASVKRVVDLGWTATPPPVAAPFYYDEDEDDDDEELPDDAAVQALLDAPPPFALTGVRGLRVPANRHALATYLGAVGPQLCALEVTLAHGFTNADVAALVAAAPGLRRLGLVGAAGHPLAFDDQGVALLGGLRHLRALRLVSLPRARTGNLLPVAQGCPALEDLELALVGEPHDGSALATLAETLEAARQLRRLTVFQPGLHLPPRLFSALARLRRLRTVAISGPQLHFNEALLRELRERAPHLQRVTVAALGWTDWGRCRVLPLEQRSSSPFFARQEYVLAFLGEHREEPSDWWRAWL